MPNWIFNRIEMDGIENKRLYTKGQLDFNKIIPEPIEKEKCPKEYILKVYDCVQAVPEKPWFNWHKWRIEHWGTKWGAFCTTKYDDAIEFDTANGAVSNELLIALSKKYPNVEITHFYGIAENEDSYIEELYYNGKNVINRNWR